MVRRGMTLKIMRRSGAEAGGRNVRQAFVLEGFEGALVRKKRAMPPDAEMLDGVAEAKLIAMRLGKPPAGFGPLTVALAGRSIGRTGDC